MSIYLSIDSGTPTFLASNTGWGDFTRWVDGQDGAGLVAHLCDHGWGEPASGIASGLRTLLKRGGPSADVKDTGENLLSLLHGLSDEAVTVNDGTSPEREIRE